MPGTVRSTGESEVWDVAPPPLPEPFLPPGFLYAWAGQHRVDLAFAATGHTHLGIAALKTSPALLLCMSLRLNQTLLQRQKTHGLPKPFIKHQRR